MNSPRPAQCSRMEEARKAFETGELAPSSVRRLSVSRLLRLASRPLAALTAAILLLAASPSRGSAAVPYSSHLRRYPYLTDVVNSYATVNWGTDQSISTGAIRWGMLGAESCTAHYVPASRFPITVNGVAEYQWRATFSVLPDTQICYRPYLGSSPSTEIDLLGSIASPVFWTQVPAGSAEPYSFVVFGDWGYVNSAGTNPDQANLMSLIAKSGARFALTAGDNSYPSGSQTNFGDLVQVGQSISAVFGPAFWKAAGASLPIFPVSGNHGFSNSDPIHPLFLNFPQTRSVGASDGRYVKETYCCVDGTVAGNYPSAWYAMDAGVARFYMLDSAWSDANIGTATAYQVDHDYKWTPGSAEYQWLQADLASHPSVLKFAVFHFPLHSDDPNQPTDTYLLGNGSLEGLLHQYGVRVAFTGHAHIYERNLPGSVGLVNYVTGGGGAPLGSLGTCSALDAYAIVFSSMGKACGSAQPPSSAAQVYHFLLVSVNGAHVTVTPTNSLGDHFDVMSYDFSAAAEGNPPSVPAGLSASAVSGMQVNLSWSAATDDTGVRGYDIYRNGQLVATTDAGIRSYSDMSRLPATDYVYTVDAFDGSANHSAQSAPVAVLTPSTATYVFMPVADSYVSAASPGSNYGSSTALIANGSPVYRSYVRFHVGDIGGEVTKATLRLYSTASSAIGYQVGGVTADTWEENLITYANAPAVGPSVDVSGGFAAGTWVSTDVTPLITGNGSFDLAITSSGSSPLTFDSRANGDLSPQLIVQTSVPAGPAFLASPGSWNYGLVRIGFSLTKTFAITNAGGSPLAIGALALTGANPDQFQLAADDCSNVALGPGATCPVGVVFAPGSTGIKTASISVPDNAGGPHSISLTGNGAAEQVLNGGFEAYSLSNPMIPRNWKAANFTTTDGKSTTVKKQGSASVRIANTYSLRKTLTQVRVLSGSAGDTLQVGAWARGRSIPSTAGMVRVVIRLFKGTTLVQTKLLAFPSGTCAFMHKSLTFIAAGPYDRMIVTLIYSKGSGIVWFDGISVIKSP